MESSRCYSPHIWRCHPPSSPHTICSHPSRASATPSAPPASPNRDSLSLVWSLVANNHYGVDASAEETWIDQAEAVEASIDRALLASHARVSSTILGVLDELGDPYSTYSPPHATLAAPSFSSVLAYGLQLRPLDDYGEHRFTVSGVLPDSPAEGAGLKAGDVLSLAPGEELLGSSLDAIVGPSSDTARHVTLQAATSTPLAVRSALIAPQRALRPTASPSVGYVRIGLFSEESTQLLRDVLSQLKLQGAQSYVIDLRNTPGGQVREAMLQATYFLHPPRADGSAAPLIAYTLDAAGHLDAHDTRSIGSLRSEEGVHATTIVADATDAVNAVAIDATSEAHASDADGMGSGLVPPSTPVVLLINRGTASAAELFAAALHDNGRAALVGERSYGKGLIQRAYALPNGGELKLTIGEYFRPNKQRVQTVKLEPDISCADQPALPGAVDRCVRLAADLADATAEEAATPAVDAVTLAIRMVDALALAAGATAVVCALAEEAGDEEPAWSCITLFNGERACGIESFDSTAGFACVGLDDGKGGLRWECS